jgi:hypothetical protein
MIQKSPKKNKLTKQWEDIYRKLTDPVEIKKRLILKRREEIAEDKISSYCNE